SQPPTHRGCRCCPDPGLCLSGGAAAVRRDARDSLHMEERPERLTRLARALSQERIDGAVLLDPATLSYFTGNQISGPNIAVVTASGECTVVCDEYDAFNFTCLGPGLAIESVPYYQDPVAAFRDWLTKRPALRRIAIEFADMRLAAQRTLAPALEGRD